MNALVRLLTSATAARAFGRGWLLLAFGFLYVPIIALVVFSFNDSPMLTHWGGFTTRWYAQLTQDRDLIEALWLSLQIAFPSACGAVVLGTLSAFTLVKYKRFPGRTLFSGMTSAPLVMPEVILGLSLLLLLVALQGLTDSPLFDRGLTAIWLGHMLLCTAYATVVIQARLGELNPQLEEAAMDLGARPGQVFFLVTLPMIGQALASAWLLAFSLSLDDVVISAFLSGPGSTTLPLVIFSRARLGLNPGINAVATVVIAVVAIAITLGSLWLARAERRRAAEISAAQRGG
ncbi:MAG: hypothetical protein RLY78_2014 [Pseudomonadota bacterium]